VEAAHPDVPELKPWARLALPLMTDPEVSQVTVAFSDISKRLRSVLDKFGMAVITEVASPDERQRLEHLFSQDLAELIDKDAAARAGADFAAVAKAAAADPKSWPLSSMQLLGPLERAKERGLPHGRFSWAARMLPRVRAVYELLHGTKDLVSSCDNAFFAPPAHKQENSNRVFPHVDQNSHDTNYVDLDGKSMADWDCYQGILYVWDSCKGRASTTVVQPRTHKDVFEAMMADEKVQKDGKQSKHFTMIQSLANKEAAARLFVEWRQKARRVPVPAGGLIIWNSRLMHQGWRGGPRLAQPVCWEPTRRRTDQAKERKLRMAALGLPSTHWASLGLLHGSRLAPQFCDPSEAKREKGNQLVLPLRSSIHPAPLVKGAQVTEMWKRFAEHPWSKPLPAALRLLLEESVKLEYKQYL